MSSPHEYAVDPPKPVAWPCQSEGFPSTRRVRSKHGRAGVVVPCPAGTSAERTGALGSALAPFEPSATATAASAVAAPAPLARRRAPPALMPRTSGGRVYARAGSVNPASV